MSIKDITVEELEHAIAGCFSFKSVAEKLGLFNSGNNLTRLKQKAEKHNIDFSHFTGQLWSKGKTALDDPRMSKQKNKDVESIFKENSQAQRTYVRHLIKKKNLLEYCCAMCKNQGTWLNKPINLQLDHINGISNDNRLQNLRWLCPNCHSQTETYCGKNINKGIKKVADEEIINLIKKGLNDAKILDTLGLAGAGNYKRLNKLRGM